MAKLPSKLPVHLQTIDNWRELLNQVSVWFQKSTSKQAPRAYMPAFREFCGLHRISSPETFRTVSGSQVIVYGDQLIHERGLIVLCVTKRLRSVRVSVICSSLADLFSVTWLMELSAPRFIRLRSLRRLVSVIV